MNVLEVTRFAIRGVTANKMRSGLTILGILIGVAAVILLVAVGNGSAQQVQQQIERLGSNTLTVFGGGFGRQASTSGPQTQNLSLTVSDAAALADHTGAPDVKSVSPVVTTSQTATYSGASTTINQITGTYPSWFEATNSPVSHGTYFTNDDVLGARKVAVIGTTAATNLFGSANPVGQQINIGGVPFTVVGVLADKGAASTFTDPNNIAIAPLSTMQETLTGYGPLSSIVAQATGPNAVNAAQTEVTAILNQRHHVQAGTTQYQILNQAQLLTTRAQTAQTFTVLLGAVAGISLLVGGIGITNIMLVTVTERIREIGIRKALGAPRRVILTQFIGEATVLSLLGGIAGVAIGVAGSVFTIDGVKPAVVPASIALALGVSLAIGLFFGSYPAHRAASLHPIDALRYE